MLENKNLGLFKFICDVSPKGTPLMYKGIVFKDIKELSDEIFVKLEKDLYSEMLRLGVISYYLIKNKDNKTAERIINLEDRARTNKEDAETLMYVLMYTLSDSPVYLYGGRAFENINSFIDYLYMNATNMDEICETVCKDKKFAGWIDFLGYHEYLDMLK